MAHQWHGVAKNASRYQRGPHLRSLENGGGRTIEQLQRKRCGIRQVDVSPPIGGFGPNAQGRNQAREEIGRLLRENRIDSRGGIFRNRVQPLTQGIGRLMDIAVLLVRLTGVQQGISKAFQDLGVPIVGSCGGTQMMHHQSTQ